MRSRFGMYVAVASVVAACAAPTVGAAGAKVKVAGPSYSKTFTVTKCVSKGESDINLTAKASGGTKGLVLRVVGKYHSGTLRITGDADLTGKLTSVSVGDAGDIKVKGKFTSGGATGALAVTGHCG